VIGTARQRLTGVISAFRKRIRATKIVEMEWVEIVAMTSGAILAVILAVAVVLVVGAAAVLVIPIAMPAAVLVLVLVGLVKLAARTAGDD
jgi:hypothetical protein